MNSLKTWLHGLMSAFIGAFATAATGSIALPSVFNFSHDGLINFAKVCAAPALVTTFAYLKQSPLPSLSTTVTSTVTQTVNQRPQP